MSSYAWIVFCAAVFLGACGPQASTFSDDDRQAVDQAVRAAVSSLTQAMNEGGPDDVMAHYAQDDGFSFLGCTEYIMGGERFREVVGPYYQRSERPALSQEVVSVQVLGPQAAAVSLRGGSDSAPALFWTQVWALRDGAWVIVLEHESWPDCAEPRAPHPMTGG